MFFKKNNNKGQGMPELIAAVGIIVFALASIISLTMFNIVGQRTSEDLIIAINLAREGIEAVRNIRDTAWLAGRSGLSDSDHKALLQFDDIGTFNLYYHYDLNIDSSDNQVCRYPSGLHYQYGLGCYESAHATKFYRLITIDFICSDDSVATVGSCPSGESIIAYRVKSEVKWADKGDSSRIYELIDYLYLWK